MEHVNYEERYPTVVTQENTPSTYSYSRPQTNASSAPAYSEKFVLDSKRQLDAHVYPEVVGKDVPLRSFYPNSVGPHEEHEVFVGSPNPRKYYGISKKVFLGVLIGVALVVVAVVAGAIGGALASKKSSKAAVTSTSSCTGSQCSSSSGVAQSGTPVTSASPTGTGTGTSGSSSTSSPATPFDPTASIGSIAASTTEGQSNGKIHIYYQQGSNIAYQSFPGPSDFTAAAALPLNIQPKAGTSIAAAEFAISGANYMQVIYQDSSNNIILANFTNPSTLQLINNVQIAEGTTAHASSSLALVYLGVTMGWRAYYQATNGTILELVGTSAGWKAGITLSAVDAIGGFPLALSMVTSPEMNIFYVDSATNNLFSISYNDGWQAPSAVTTTAITKWDGSNTSLAAIQESDPLYMRIYYIGTDSEIHEFYANPGGPFSTTSDQSTHWEVLDSQGPGAIAGIGWSDQVRLYYVSEGKIVQTSLGNATWSSSTDL